MKKNIAAHFLVFIFSLCATKISAQALIPCTFICATTEISGDVTLQWIESTETCGAFVEYIIYASNDLDGPYTILDFIFSETTTSYNHIGADGTTTIWYYYIEALYDCAGFIITASDTLDNLDPAAPVINYVTVGTAGVNIFWFPSASAKTSAYIIYRDETGFTAIDTVYGRFTTTYTDLTASAGSQIETYTIAALDACDNVGPLNVNAHHTIYMYAEQEECSENMNLSWNFYDTWDLGVSEYQVWLDINFTGATLLASLSPSSSTYIYSGLNDSDDYSFTIYAVRSDNTAISHSNTWSFNLNVVTAAEFNIVSNATVIPSSDVNVSWYPDAAADLQYYKIMRSDDDGATFFPLFTADVENPVTSPDTFTDTSVAVYSQSYTYKVVTVDSCENEFESGTVNTIYFNGFIADGFKNVLEWNTFEMTNATLIDYTIYRNETGIWNVLTTADALATTYTDDISPIITISDTACYYVVANYQLNTASPPLSEMLQSVSNAICLQQEAQIYIPNAIIPGSANGIFKPVIIFGTNAGFTMQVFNRYGEMIFQSLNENEGWDGTFKGDIVPSGAYAYLISFQSANGEYITKKGNVLVVR